MINVAWVQLVVGVALMFVGLATGWRSGGRVIVLVGSISVALGAAILIGNARSDLQTPALVIAAVYALGLATTAPRAAWRAVRVELTLGVATIAGIWMLYLFYPGPASASAAQNLLLLLVRVLGWTFVAALIVRVLIRARGSSASQT